MKKVLYILTVLLLISTTISAQDDWVKIYGDDEDVYVYDLIQMVIYTVLANRS
jgi:hypothetical protein